VHAADAVEQLARFSDDVLALYLLQLVQARARMPCERASERLMERVGLLVQCLKTEPFHDSPLTRLLVKRALANMEGLGFALFWHLRSQLLLPQWCERFSLILEEIVTFCGPHAAVRAGRSPNPACPSTCPLAQELRRQVAATDRFQEVAELVVKLKRSGGARDSDSATFAEELRRTNDELLARLGPWSLPLDPRLRLTTLRVDQCRYMTSKKARAVPTATARAPRKSVCPTGSPRPQVPLWLVADNADPLGEPVSFIFKSGDDLRQDQLVLQLLQVMDNVRAAAPRGLRSQQQQQGTQHWPRAALAAGGARSCADAVPLRGHAHASARRCAPSACACARRYRHRPTPRRRCRALVCSRLSRTRERAGRSTASSAAERAPSKVSARCSAVSFFALTAPCAQPT
jgi:hypothetical protein